MKKLFILFFLISASITYAQSKDKLGFNFGCYGSYPYTGSIGLTYHISEQRVLRPSMEFSITKSNDESEQYEREEKKYRLWGIFEPFIYFKVIGII